ncbi:hypothetical protein AFGD_006340 [Aspergillus flavus]|nr:hypothetical protein AFGD_006340 [Aspergillus flavus]
MPFYTLAVNYDPTSSSSNLGSLGVHKTRTLIITPDRETSDSLFRIIQDNPSGVNPQAPFKHVQRISPQMWSWTAQDNNNNSKDQLAKLILAINNKTAVITNDRSGNPLKRLQGRVTLHALPDWDSQTLTPIIPNIETADYISGNLFCIRNKRSPDKYWAKPPGDYHWIRLSSIIRTRFRIRAVGKPDGTVMIPDDHVEISVVRLDENNNEQEFPLGYQDFSGRLAEVAKEQRIRIWFESFLAGGISLDYRGSENETNNAGAEQNDSGWKPTDDELTYPLYPVFYDESQRGGEMWELC